MFLHAPACVAVEGHSVQVGCGDYFSGFWGQMAPARPTTIQDPDRPRSSDCGAAKLFGMPYRVAGPSVASASYPRILYSIRT